MTGTECRSAKRKGNAGTAKPPVQKRLTMLAQLLGPVRLPALLLADLLLGQPAWAAAIAVNALPVAKTSSPVMLNGAQVTSINDISSLRANLTSSTVANTMTITQTAPTNIVQWNSFDIGAQAKVVVNQPSATAVLLNKVDGGLTQTTIDGMLNANGRVYIYNPNGIIFGKTAVVNVDTLIASSLKFDESRVIGGLLQPGTLPVLGADPSLVPGAILVDGTLNAANGSMILLAAPDITNNGILNAPDGQVILAAGSKVYLAAPQVSQTGTSLRGLVVEVSNAASTVSTATNSTTASTATNSTTAQINVGRGNATMIGYAVNQNGLISASTSVSLNGSIYLLARDGAMQPDANNPVQATRTGKLVLGAGSVTEVLPTLDDTATISGTTTFNKSVVKLNGSDIELQGNAAIIAPGGAVSITAQQLTAPGATAVIIDPGSTAAPRVDLGVGSVIDVSGSSGTELAMESNVITVDLRGTELADNVVLRNSALYGSQVQIDIRKGTPVANVSGWLGLIQYNLGQLNTAGGTVAISADGAIIQRANSTINVNGGSVDYLSGYVNTTQLQLGNQLVDIGSALTNTLYTAAITLPNSASNYQAGYVQGSSAGTVKFSAPIEVLQGALSGQVTIGALQRDVSAAGYPQGGQLQIGNVSSGNIDSSSGIAITTNASNFGYIGNIDFGGTATALAVPPAVGAAFDSANAGQNLLTTTLDLNPATLAAAGFNRITALTSGNIDVNQAVNLAAGGHFWLGSGLSTLSFLNGVVPAGGNIMFAAPVSLPGGSVTAAASGLLQIAEDTGFNLAGLWTNDQLVTGPQSNAAGYLVAPVVSKGGTLNLSAFDLSVGNNVTMDVSAGAWENASGKVTQGKAGSITLTATPFDPVQSPYAAILQLGSNLTLSAYGFGSGGTLNLTGGNVVIGSTPIVSTPTVDKLLPAYKVNTGSVNGDLLQRVRKEMLLLPLPPSPTLSQQNAFNLLLKAQSELLLLTQDDLMLAPAFFQQGGFTSYNISANNNLNVLTNTQLTPQAQSWQLNAQAGTTPTGVMSSAASPYLFNLAGSGTTRAATSLTLSALAQTLPTTGANGLAEKPGDSGRLLVDSGASVTLDPGANLDLFAGIQLTELGMLNAPAGNIVAGLTANPSATTFDATRSIWFGSTAQVLARGSNQRLYTNSGGVSTGSLLNGGTIQIGSIQNGALSAASGYVVAQTGSLFDVSGVWQRGVSFKLGGQVAPMQNVASSGGSISIDAREGLLFAGALRGRAGGAGASGGSLSIAMDDGGLAPGGYPDQTETLTVLNSKTSNTQLVPAGLTPDAAIVSLVKGNWLLYGSKAGINAKLDGQGWISTAAFQYGGFGRLSLASSNILAFGMGQGGINLSAGDALYLNAPNLSAYNNSTNNAVTTSAVSRLLSLSAPYVEIGSQNQNYQTPGAASFGIASLTASATTLDLIGNTALQGFGTVNLNAATDIRLVGISVLDPNTFKATGYAQGSLAMRGNLTLTDTQTYPTTLSDFSFTDSASNGILTFASNGNTPGQVLSAAGTVTAIAPTINQNGVLLAPFGSLTLGSTAVTQTLNYGAASVTSVAGNGIVPFGTVVNGSVPGASSWEYSLSDGTQVSIVQNPVTGGNTLERALPSKAIVSSAVNITSAAGSVQNVSGGGTLLGYEFTPGSGGSMDVLANNTSGNTTVFAINPNYQGSVAPVDGQYGQDGGLLAGNSVYLSGMNGLAAGYYTLLPAHYALLPGGFSITVAAGTANMQASGNTQLANGAMLMAGHLSDTGSFTGSTTSNGFIVSSSTVINSQSQFTLYDAGSYFAGTAALAGLVAPALPSDGGYIAFDATGASTAALLLNGSINLKAASGGIAGTADFAAPQIAVVSSLTQNTGTAVQLLASNLTALGADSLLLGGLRSTVNGVTAVNVQAGSVTLSNDADHALSGADILLAANNNITVNSGAVLQGTGTPGNALQTLTVAGNGALLNVSGGAAVALQRSNPATTAGTLAINRGATVAASGSALLDATAGISLASPLTMSAGSALSLSSNGISLGSVIPVSVTGLKLDTTTLGNLAQLSLNSYASTINLYGTVNLGSSTMTDLTLSGSGIQGNNSTATMTANTISVSGASATASSLLATAPTGTLTIQGNQLQIGNNAYAINGFSATTVNAASDVKATAAAGQLSVAGALALNAGQIDTASGAHAAIVASGAMTLGQNTTPFAATTPIAATSGMGGSLSFKAASITSTAQILAPAGKVLMSADNGIDISSGKISVAGQSVVFGSTTAYAPGGTISLNGGSVSLGAASTLDLSATGATAGTLSISATRAGGTVQLAGSLLGNAYAGVNEVVPVQGQFSLSADQLALVMDKTGSSGNFGSLNNQLNAAGFTEARQFSFNQGDVNLAAGNTVTAHQIGISTSNGNINIAGTLNASGAQGGSIALYASQPQASGNTGQVTVSDGAALLVKGSTGQGGTIAIATGSADGLAPTGSGSSINLNGGTMDAGGATGNGSVTLTAPRLASDVAIAAIGTQINNSAATVIVANQVYKANSIIGLDATQNTVLPGGINLDPSTGGVMYTDAAGFMGNQQAILARIGGTNISLSPGVEVRSTGDLTVSVNEYAAQASVRGWNLDAWRFNGAPVMLSLRAAGNLNIIGSISDGFVQPVNSLLSMPDWALGTGTSASFQLTGGANLSAANPLAVIAGQGGVNFNFASRAPSAFSTAKLDAQGLPVLDSSGSPIYIPGTWQSTDGVMTSTNVTALQNNAPVTASDAPVALVRTGTGNIEIASGGNVSMAMAPFFVQTSTDVSINGTPVPSIYQPSPNGSYQVAVYGASIYTAGQAAALQAGFVAPQNQLNTSYGATTGMLTPAAFGTGGGALTITATGSISGPQDLAASWAYNNADGSAPVAAVPKNGTTPATPYIAGIAGTQVSLPATTPLLVDNWLFRQGRSYQSVDSQGNSQTVFEQTGSLDPVTGQVVYTGTLNTAWWARTDYFNQGVATLGGGNISVTAGSNIANFSASVASNAYMPTTTSLIQQGGDSLMLHAGGDLLGGSFYVQQGNATLRADGSVAAGSTVPPGAASALNPVLALGDATINVIAGRNTAVESSYNPMLTEQSVNNVQAGDSAFGPVAGVGSGGARWNVTDLTQASLAYRLKYAQFSDFSTYSDNSAVNLTAVGGNLLLSGNTAALSVAGGNAIANALVAYNGEFNALYALNPATVNASALSGNLTSSNGFTLMAAPQGQLNLLAANSISLSDGISGSLRMLDSNPALMSTAAAPTALSSVQINVLNGTATGIAAHMLGGLHTTDTQPVRLVALAGDITGDANNPVTISLPKQAEISAGRDIVNLGFAIQQNNAADVTGITAGRDFIDTTQYNNGSPSPVQNIVTGPGRVDISAGRNVDFGNGSGLVTRGNLDNPYLSEGGADINITAGTGAANYVSFVSFANQYGSSAAITPDAQALLDLQTLIGVQDTALAAKVATMPTDQLLAAFLALPQNVQDAFTQTHTTIVSQLNSYVDLIKLVDANTAATAADSLTAINLWAQFRTLSASLQSNFLDAHPLVAASLANSTNVLNSELASGNKTLLNASFFSDLVELGSQSKLSNMDNLIAALFPDAASAKVAGNIAVFNSQIKTEQGGGINLYAPTGSVYAGLTTGSTGKTPSTQGIFTIRGGAISALVKNDFLVNQGRVFTLGGGDITLVSQYANIDAGKGAKTASSAPPPLITIDANGNINVDVSGSIAGSGIATLQTHPDQAAANIYVLAPRGIFNLGDAGVRSTGKLKAIAQTIVNGGNYSGGGASGLPSSGAAAPSISTPSTPSSTPANTDSAGKSTASSASEKNNLTVQVVGYGQDALPATGSSDDAPDANGPDGKSPSHDKKDCKKDPLCHDQSLSSL